MTPEAQCIAIAELSGWIRFSSTGWRITKPGMRGWITCPDYLHNLDAMHEAEKTLTSEKQCGAYAMNLALICKGFAHDPFIGVGGYIWHATGAQRAEALLRTMNLWDDTK